jgi:hypothetical protein
MAGSWSSGGGEILEHAQNPWFIDVGQPIKPISYCVVVGDDFPVGQRSLEDLVEAAFGWWTNQFSNAHFPENTAYFSSKGEQKVVVGINTSHIYKQNCSSDVDLAFQFGHLEPYQIDEFKTLNVDLTRYVALTIRTDYSDELRGKGFIYVSPDRGPNAFTGHNILPNAWTENDENFTRLRGIIVHEMGHVFGLKHGATNDTIMSAKFAEATVTRIGYPYYNSLNEAVFFPKQGRLNDTFCDPLEPKYKNIRAFFEIPDTTECLRIFLDMNQLYVSTGRKQHNLSWELVGRAKFDNRAERYHQLVSLWLPPTQTLFKNLTWPSVLLGAASAEIQQAAVFKNEVSGKHSPLFIQATPRFVQIGGLLGDEMIPDLLPEEEYSTLSGWEYK